MVELFEILTVVSAAANRLVELLKQGVIPFGLSDRVQALVVFLISLAVGQAVAFAAKLDLLEAMPISGDLPDWFGYVVTGLAIMLGSNVLDVFYDIAVAVKGRVTPPNEANHL